MLDNLYHNTGMKLVDENYDPYGVVLKEYSELDAKERLEYLQHERQTHLREANFLRRKLEKCLFEIEAFNREINKLMEKKGGF